MALANLCQMLMPGHDLLLNCSLDGSHTTISQYLLNSFLTVECIYYDSVYSAEVEDKSSLSSSNIVSETIRCESSVPNDACMHKQLFLHARSLILPPCGVTNFEPNSDSVISLNAVPKVKSLVFSDDLDLVAHLSSNNGCSAVFITSKFFSTDIGRKFCLALESISVPFYVLSTGLAIPSHLYNFYYVGLEQGWSWDLAQDRLAINQLRQRQDSANHIVFVKERGDSVCRPSVVSLDF
ncbi:hypothetical protein [Synechococcus sp. CC9616]|uniref:hypothetical protein n=1 Tax=Synechococcus sp. CC9616 TaxID=110663 RepID=UPI0012EBDFB4|nr:hypothetical protein [Synechococcus sp. CC9616]